MMGGPPKMKTMCVSGRMDSHAPKIITDAVDKSNNMRYVLIHLHNCNKAEEIHRGHSMRSVTGMRITYHNNE